MKQYLSLFGLFFLLACSQYNQAQEVVDAFQFDSILSADSNVFLLDIRTKEEFEGGYIKGASHLDFYADSFFVEAVKLDKSKRILVYGLSDKRAAQASSFLRLNGFKVTELLGGISAWRNASLPVEGGYALIKQIAKTREQFFSELDSNQMYLVDFNANWCLPCRELLPILDRLDSAYANQLQVLKVEYDANKQLAQDFKVEGLPYLMMIRNGQVIWSNFGLISEAELRQAIDSKL